MRLVRAWTPVVKFLASHSEVVPTSYPYRSLLMYGCCRETGMLLLTHTHTEHRTFNDE
jgi:hypothetical protein